MPEVFREVEVSAFVALFVPEDLEEEFATRALMALLLSYSQRVMMAQMDADAAHRRCHMASVHLGTGLA